MLHLADQLRSSRLQRNTKLGLSIADWKHVSERPWSTSAGAPVGAAGAESGGPLCGAAAVVTQLLDLQIQSLSRDTL